MRLFRGIPRVVASSLNVFLAVQRAFAAHHFLPGSVGLGAVWGPAGLSCAGKGSGSCPMAGCLSESTVSLMRKPRLTGVPRPQDRAREGTHAALVHTALPLSDGLSEAGQCLGARSEPSTLAWACPHITHLWPVGQGLHYY